MAATITVTETGTWGPAGRKNFVLTITETDVAASTEVEVDLSTYGLPTAGRIMAQIAALTSLGSGTAVTIDPVLGLVTDPASGAWGVDNETAAALIHNQPASGICYAGATSLFHRSVPNAGTDGAVTTTYYIRSGWVG